MVSERARMECGGDRKKVLISTIGLYGGGVNTMARFAVSLLAERGFEPVVASYLPYSLEPGASVPLWALPFRRPRARSHADPEGFVVHEIGAWLPEIECLHEFPNRHWRELALAAQYHVAVCGTAIGAMSLHALGIPHVAWVATPWQDERDSRADEKSGARKAFDLVVNAPTCRAMERIIVREGRTVALSGYTRRALNRVAGGEFVRHVLRVPLADSAFSPSEDAVVRGRVGFVGRLGDVRKNLRLLLNALALCRRDGLAVGAYLVGGGLPADLVAHAAALGLSDSLTVVDYIERERLPELLRTFDVYALSSRQEGLCIAALEAMACGVPVVSTRCGGPEEFVTDGVNGFLVGHSAEEMAARLRDVVENRSLRERLARGAEETIRSDFTRARCAGTFWEAFEEQFPS